MGVVMLHWVLKVILYYLLLPMLCTLTGVLVTFSLQNVLPELIYRISEITALDIRLIEIGVSSFIAALVATAVLRLFGATRRGVAKGLGGVVGSE